MTLRVIKDIKDYIAVIKEKQYIGGWNDDSNGKGVTYGAKTV